MAEGRSSGNARRGRGAAFALRCLACTLLMALAAVFPGVSSLGEGGGVLVWLSPVPALASDAAPAPGKYGDEWLKGLEDRVLSLLAPVYGAGHVVVRASYGGTREGTSRPPVSVAVVVDTAVVGVTPGSSDAIRSEQERLCGLVAHAAGLSGERGDAVAVSFLLFTGREEGAWWPYALAAALVLLLAGGGLLLGRRRRSGESHGSDGLRRREARNLTGETTVPRAAQDLADRLRGERPQARAVALALLGPAEAAETLGALPAGMRAETVACMALQGRVGKDVVELVRRDLIGAGAAGGGEGSPLDGTGDAALRTANVLRLLDGTRREEILSEMRSFSPKAWSRLSPHMDR